LNADTLLAEWEQEDQQTWKLCWKTANNEGSVFYTNLCWLLRTSVRKNREQANLCSMERQRNAPASREKDNIFSFYLEGNQRNLEMVIAFYPYFFRIPGTNAFRGLCCSLIVMVQPT